MAFRIESNFAKRIRAILNLSWVQNTKISVSVSKVVTCPYGCTRNCMSSLFVAFGVYTLTFIGLHIRVFIMKEQFLSCFLFTIVKPTDNYKECGHVSCMLSSELKCCISIESLARDQLGWGMPWEHPPLAQLRGLTGPRPKRGFQACPSLSSASAEGKSTVFPFGDKDRQVFLRHCQDRW